MTHPLITRLTDEMSWPDLVDWDALAAFTAQPGVHALFVPGDPKRNLETADVAVILPELKMAFQGRFDCAVVGTEIETRLREETRVLKTPSLIFYRDGQMIGAIPRVRDWDEYIARINQILAQPVAAE
ncbi:hydrogenase accessory protein [Thalassovita sp.]|uniref:hydrogenase accessory protein n=1 Tax=Thalassovita sp. TaxID=1979401 RepID=UPI002882C618|nr:hydrogenase accessory protein [Thalassovita sp.]MDF1803408.1 hydrogenase accessory protein [Thalassovita sp.]